MPASFFNVDPLGDGTYDGEPDGAFFQGGDTEPAEGAHDPGELGLTPTQFAATADQQQRHATLDADQLQRLATLDDASRQQTDEISRQRDAAADAAAHTAATFLLQSNASDATSALIAQLQQEQAAQKIRSAALTATTDKLASDVTALSGLIKGQADAIATMGANVASLTASCREATAVATATAACVSDLTAKIDQLLSNGGRRDSAMGVGKDDDTSSDAASSARKKVKNADGASAATA